MAVIAGHVDDDGLPPAEKEVTGGGAEDDGQAEPGVESHDDEHEEVGECQLKRQKGYNVFFKCANPGLFFAYFRSFHRNNTFFTIN